MKNITLKLGLILLLGLVSNASFAERTTTYMHSNALGSVIAASDEDGNLLWRKHYQPFGSQVEGGNESEEVSYTGKKFDKATGLSYYGARYYDPHMGRFTGVDPVGVLGSVESNPMMFNRYAYANNNPYKYVDPDGRQAEFAFELGQEITRRSQLGQSDSQIAKGFVKEGLIGAAAGTTLTAVAFSPQLLTAAASRSPQAYLLGIELTASEVGLSVSGGAITTEVVRNALQGSNLKTVQQSISLPGVQRFVEKLIRGERPSPIKLDGDVIVDGNTRYAAGRVFGLEPPTQAGALAPSQTSKIKPISEIDIDTVDFGQR